MADHTELHHHSACQDAPVAAPSGLQAQGGAAVVNSDALLQGQRELLIQHQGHIYRLQATRQGKLILTK